MASLTAAGTAYATWGQPMIPFFIFYSMFGFQRVGDLIWAFGDQRGRGFLLGATAGRTTLTGEGLQHCDGQSHVLASTVPELPRVRPGVRVRGRGDHPRRASSGCTARRPRTSSTTSRSTTRTTRCRRCPTASRTASCAACTATARRRRSASTARRSSRAAPRCSPALDAQQLLADELRRGRRRVERDELQAAARGRARGGALEPAAPDGAAARAVRDRVPRRTTDGPIVAVTDFMKSVPDQIAPVRAAAVRAARHRRLRVLRHARRAAPPLRGRRRRTSWSRRSTRSRAVVRSRPSRGGRRDPPVRSRSRAPGPANDVAGRGRGVVTTPGGRLRRSAAGRPRPSRRGRRRLRRARWASSSGIGVGERALALGEQAVVEALLQLTRLAEPAGPSLPRHGSPTSWGRPLTHPRAPLSHARRDPRARPRSVGFPPRG